MVAITTYNPMAIGCFHHTSSFVFAAIHLSYHNPIVLSVLPLVYMSVKKLSFLIISCFLLSAHTAFAATEDVHIAAAVPATPTDFSVAIAATPSARTLGQNTTITYGITYESHLAYPTAITIEADWNMEAHAQVPVVAYVIDSATSAYGNAQPVIDLIDRRIQWYIPILPGNTSGEVQFQLRTTELYTGGSAVDFTVATRILGIGTSTTDATLIKTYRYNAPAQQPSSTPQPQTNITPTPVKQQKLQITDVSLASVSSSQAAIHVRTSLPAKYTLFYGTSRQTLLNQISTLSHQTASTFHITGLKAATDYYLTVQAIAPDGTKAMSDIYTFQTATTISEIGAPTSTIIIGDDILLYASYAYNIQSVPSISIPEKTHLTVNLGFPDIAKIASIHLLVRDEETVAVTPLAAMNSLYLGTIFTPLQGYFTLVSRVTDVYGNINEIPIAFVRVKSPMRVTDASTHKPIDHAKISTTIFHPQTQLYTPISETLRLSEIMYSDSAGIVHLVLPPGIYRSTVSASGYESKTVGFSIGTNDDSYPDVMLQKLPFSIGTFLSELMQTGADAIHLWRQTANEYGDSFRFYKFELTLVTILFTLLSLTALSARFGIPLIHLFRVGIYHMSWHRLPKHLRAIVRGSIIDKETKQPISNTAVLLLSKENKLLSRTQSGKDGSFHFPITDKSGYISFAKPGYIMVTHELKDAVAAPLTITLTNHHLPLQTVLEVILGTIKSSITLLLEVLLFASLILSLFFGVTFGVSSAAPLLFFSGGNIALWRFLMSANRHVL
jgi:hypothetical protein